MKQERQVNMTAEEWLVYTSSPDEWTFSMRLERVETGRIEAEASQPIQDALFYKGLYPRDHFLAPGELERLVVIMQAQYPYAFNLWLKEQIDVLKEFAGKKIHPRGIYTDVQYFVELKPSFESAKGYDEVRDIIEWV